MALVLRGRTSGLSQADRRAALLEAALDLIGEAEASAVTMRAVRRKAGRTDRYCYESFGDQDAPNHVPRLSFG